jgi:hypothetical protein
MPRDRDAWAGAAGGPSPVDGAAAGDPPPGCRRMLVSELQDMALKLVLGAVLLGAVIAVLVLLTSDDDDAGGPGADVGGALGTVTTLPSNAGTVLPPSTPATTAAPDAGGSGSGGDDPGAGLPPVTVPAEASPPTTIPGSDPSSVPADIFSGEELPQFGTLVVDLEPEGYLDFAVHLEAGYEQLQVLSLADDGVRTYIEMFAPDGSSEGSWEGGEPETVNGLEWYLPDEPLPATGTYVIRVIHTGGDHGPFAIGFFGTR